MNAFVPWMLVAGAVIALAAGQVLFKMAAMKLQAAGGDSWWNWINMPIVAAFAVYFFATLLWVGALRTLPLRIAYPAFAFSFILVPTLAHFVLDEPFTFRALIGAAAIIVGVAISVSGA